MGDPPIKDAPRPWSARVRARVRDALSTRRRIDRLSKEVRNLQARVDGLRRENLSLRAQLRQAREELERLTAPFAGVKKN